MDQKYARTSSILKKNKYNNQKKLKTKTTKKMVKLKGMIASLVLISLSAGILQSCNKLEESSLPEATHNADLAALESSSFESGEVREGSLTRRPNQDITNPSWTPGNYDPIVALNYQIRSPQKNKGDTYRFVVTSTNFARKHIYIKYYSPQGNEVFEKMRPNPSYTSFEIQRRFQQEGIYHIRFFVESSALYLPYPSIHKDSYKINVELPVNVPPIGDDYEQYAQYAGTQGTGANAFDYEQWGFAMYNCTSWVALKMNQMWADAGQRFHNKIFGKALSNAKNWKEIFSDNGYRVDQQPKAGAILWIQPGYHGTSTTFGHVGFVHSVRNGRVFYSDYNHNKDKSWHTNSFPLNNIGHRYFIHAQKPR